MTWARQALRDLDAVEVDLDGTPGFALPDDLDEDLDADPWGALLPGLDVTTMGWYDRDWYLGEHRSQVFDTNGNAGPTAWWNGRVVGGWTQDAEGRVELRLLEDVGRDGRKALTRRAERFDRVARRRADQSALPFAAVQGDDELMTEVAIRPATSADAGVCARVMYAAFESLATRHAFPIEPQTPEFTGMQMEFMLTTDGIYRPCRRTGWRCRRKCVRRRTWADRRNRACQRRPGCRRWRRRPRPDGISLVPVGRTR